MGSRVTPAASTSRALTATTIDRSQAGPQSLFHGHHSLAGRLTCGKVSRAASKARAGQTSSPEGNHHHVVHFQTVLKKMIQRGVLPPGDRPWSSARRSSDPAWSAEREEAQAGPSREVEWRTEQKRSAYSGYGSAHGNDRRSRSPPELALRRQHSPELGYRRARDEDSRAYRDRHNADPDWRFASPTGKRAEYLDERDRDWRQAERFNQSHDRDGGRFARDHQTDRYTRSEYPAWDRAPRDWRKESDGERQRYERREDDGRRYSSRWGDEDNRGRYKLHDLVSDRSGKDAPNETAINGRNGKHTAMNGHSRSRVALSDEEEDGLQQLWKKANGRIKQHPSIEASTTHVQKRSEQPASDALSPASRVQDSIPCPPRTTDYDTPQHNAREPEATSGHMNSEQPVRPPSPTDPAPPPPPDDETAKLTLHAEPGRFQSFKLPHELMHPKNVGLVQKTPKGVKLKSYRLSYDPELDKDKSGKGKTAIKVDLHPSASDPRDRSSRRKARKDLRVLVWKWDSHSTRPKPPPPPRSLVVSGLSPMTTAVSLKQHFRAFGRIEDTELKLDPSTGMSTGVFYICFAHDYGDGLVLHADVGEAKAQRGDLAAEIARKKSDGQRIGLQEVKVEFDDLDRTVFRKTYRNVLSEKIEAAKAKKQTHDATSAPSSSTTLLSSPSMPPPGAPRGPKSLSGPHPGHPVTRPNAGNHATYSSQSPSPHPLHTSTGAARNEQLLRASFSDNYSRSRTWLDDDAYNNPQTSRQSAQSDVISRTANDDLHGNAWPICASLRENGKPHAFVARVKGSNVNTEAIQALFTGMHPSWIKSDESGWYIAFPGPDDANRAKKVLDGRALNGYRITLEVRQPPSAKSAGQEMATRSGNVVRQEISQKTSWTDEELFEDSRLLVLREMGNTFMRDLRTRVLNKFVTEFLSADKQGGQLLRAPMPKIEEIDEIEIDLTSERPKTFNRAAKEEQRRRLLQLQEEAARHEREAQLESEEENDQSLAATGSDINAEKKGKKSSKTRKVEAAATAAAAAAVVEASLDEDTRVEKKFTKKVARPQSPPLDPFASGLAEDEEDLYFCRIALEMIQRGESVQDLREEEWRPDEEDEQALPHHSSGCARTEGFYRIPPAEKGRHLADRNLGSTDTSAPANVGLASARDNRADSRRFVQGIEQHKKETATDTDILKFNQLRSRNKQLKFAKSPIHDWGLYAMEMIPPGDMVIEYVGEIVRQQVADEREKAYERQGNFSTYLFRVDDDIVVDATKKGNIARLMNHCCTPNCNAKILTLNGEKRIVLYAKQAILPGQELTYDYKFQASGDEEDAIACLCGSTGCRRFL